MKNLLLSSFGILSTAMAMPLAGDDPIRILPKGWTFEIVDLKGPGCPDLKTEKPYRTRENHGHNTVDGSEIYYWVLAYPHLRASIPAGEKEASVWCETTLKYTEFGFQDSKPAADYRFKAHKNGTEISAFYELDEGVSAKWKFTYDFGETKIVDQAVVNGPTPRTETHLITESSKLQQYKMPECGTGVIKYRTDLTLSSDKEGKKGVVDSKLLTYEGMQEYYGTLLGISFDWEKC